MLVTVNVIYILVNKYIIFVINTPYFIYSSYSHKVQGGDKVCPILSKGFGLLNMLNY